MGFVWASAARYVDLVLANGARLFPCCFNVGSVCATAERSRQSTFLCEILRLRWLGAVLRCSCKICVFPLVF